MFKRNGVINMGKERYSILFSSMTGNTKELADAIRKTTGLYVSEGAQYGKTGEQFLRINLACQRSRIADGCERLKRGVEAYRNQK